jgi:hypothetical protein
MAAMAALLWHGKKGVHRLRETGALAQVLEVQPSLSTPRTFRP